MHGFPCVLCPTSLSFVLLLYAPILVHSTLCHSKFWKSTYQLCDFHPGATGQCAGHSSTRIHSQGVSHSLGTAAWGDAASSPPNNSGASHCSLRPFLVPCLASQACTVLRCACMWTHAPFRFVCGGFKRGALNWRGGGGAPILWH